MEGRGIGYRQGWISESSVHVWVGGWVYPLTIMHSKATEVEMK